MLELGSPHDRRGSRYEKREFGEQTLALHNAVSTQPKITYWVTLLARNVAPI